MNFFEGECQECGKKIVLLRPDGRGFCSKVCETNFKFRNKFGRDHNGLFIKDETRTTVRNG